MDRLHLISVFVAVVDASSFAGAARKLGLSPPAVTRAINELERALGVRLLTRTTRVVRVTEAGARYVEDCRRILAELADADESARGAHGEPRGHLTVTAPVLFGALYVTPVLTEYLQLHTGVTASGAVPGPGRQPDGGGRRRGRAHRRAARLVPAGGPGGAGAAGDLRVARLPREARHARARPTTSRTIGSSPPAARCLPVNGGWGANGTASPVPRRAAPRHDHQRCCARRCRGWLRHHPPAVLPGGGTRCATGGW